MNCLKSCDSQKIYIYILTPIIWWAMITSQHLMSNGLGRRNRAQRAEDLVRASPDKARRGTIRHRSTSDSLAPIPHDHANRSALARSLARSHGGNRSSLAGDTHTRRVVRRRRRHRLRLGRSAAPDRSCLRRQELRQDHLLSPPPQRPPPEVGPPIRRHLLSLCPSRSSRYTRCQCSFHCRLGLSVVRGLLRALRVEWFRWCGSSMNVLRLLSCWADCMFFDTSISARALQFDDLVSECLILAQQFW